MREPTVWAVTDPQGRVIGVGRAKALGALGDMVQRRVASHEDWDANSALVIKALDDPDAPCYEHAGYRVAPVTLLTSEALAVVDAAVAWWSMARPVAWDEATHRQHPKVNQPSDAAKALAEAVAASLAATARDGKGGDHG